MSLTGGAAIAAALLQLGVYDPGETPSTSEQNACLLILNQMMASWYNEQLLGLQVLIQEQNEAGTIFIAQQNKLTSSLVREYTLAGATYTVPSYTAGSATGATVPNFPDLTTPQTFPSGYDLAIVLNGAVLLAAQYPGVGQAPQTLMDRATAALLAAVTVPGRIPLPGVSTQGGTVSPGGAQNTPGVPAE